MTITIQQIEATALAAFKAAESFFAADPAAQQLADTAKAAISQAKGEALSVASDGIADALTPVLGTVEAKAAAPLVVQFLAAHVGSFVAPEIAKAESDIEAAVEQ